MLSTQLVIDAMPEPVCIKDKTSRYLMWNNAFADMLGVEKNFLTDKSDDDFFSAPIAKEYRLEERKIMLNKDQKEYKESFNFKGVKKNFRVSKNALLHNDAPIGVLCQFHDISKEMNDETEMALIQNSIEQAQKLAQIGHWAYNPNKDILYWSDQTYRIFGYEPKEKEITYNNFKELIHPDDYHQYIDSFNISIEMHTNFHINHRIIKVDGTIASVETRCTHEYDDNGDLIRSIGTIHDITERREREEQLSLLQKIMRSLNLGLIIADEDVNVIQINDTCRKLLGYSQKDLKGKRAPFLTQTIYNKAVYKTMWRKIIDYNAYNSDTVIMTKSGKPELFHFYISTLMDENEKIKHFLIEFHEKE